MLVGFDATTIRGNKTGVGYYTARLLERLTRVGGRANPIDELVVLSNLELALSSDLPRTTIYRGARFGIRGLWMQGALPMILRRLRPDVCHFTNFLAPLSTSSPYVVTFHDMSLQLLPRYHTLKKRLLTAALMPEVAKRARLIITPSESARSDVARTLGVARSKIRAIPHAPDPLFRPERSKKSFERLVREYGLRKPYLLYVGTLEPRKNITRAIEAFAKVAHRFPDHFFYLVGGLGWKYGETLRALARLGLGDRVRRLGYVPEEDLPALYSHADLMVYPSLYEGFGFPVVEGMACGVPVLTSKSSSLREIADGAALLVDPYDVGAMAEAMERGLNRGRERDELIARGLSRAGSFSWERTAAETLEVYLEAAERVAVRGVAVESAPPSEAAKAITETVGYGALFGFPMKLDEIHRGLMGVRLSRKETERLLSSNASVRARIERRGPYFFLRGHGKSIPVRWSRERQTRELLERHRRIVRFFCRAPYVRLAALSGATAHGNASDGDIDLFVITAPGRTWAVSFLFVLIAKLAGLRRVLCVNYLVSERAMAVSDEDPFTAQQIASLRPLAGSRTYRRFVRANQWGARYFPNFWSDYVGCAQGDDSDPSAGSPWLEALLSFGGGWALERLGRVLLRSYLRWQHGRAGYPASVRLDAETIKLHFKDHGRPLNMRLNELLGEVESEAHLVAGEAGRARQIPRAR